METIGRKSKQNGFKALFNSKLIVFIVLTTSSVVFSQATVSSLSALMDYLDDDNADVKLSPGTYSVSEADVKNGTYSNPLFQFSGNNSTYDFTGVTIHFDTKILDDFGSKDTFRELTITGNNNVLKNLTMVDVGSKTDHPAKSATNVTIDGSHNRAEGFHMTVKGSWPYGYSSAFGKGARAIIKHYKHSGLLVRGESNHVKNVTMIHRAYGHGIFTQAANNAIIEGCYVEGEVRSTDDILAEKGTGSPADKVDFKTVWGYTLQPGYKVSLQEDGIRAYNGGDTVIDGKSYRRGTHNITVLNNTVKYMRGGVTLTHATGKKYVEGCMTIGCQRGYAIGSGDIVNCRSDASYGPAFGVDYDSDRNITADITILPSDDTYNGSHQLAFIVGRGHDLTFRSSESNPDQSLKMVISGVSKAVVDLGKNEVEAAHNIKIHNLTQYPLTLGLSSSGTTGESCGTITDNGSGNNVDKIDCGGVDTENRGAKQMTDS